MTELLEIDDLVIDYIAAGKTQRALDGATLKIATGETLGIAGESGSGKSTLAAAVGGLLPTAARYIDGKVRLAGQSVIGCSDKDIRNLRREHLGYVFQDPIGSLDPTMRVGRQLALVLGGRPGDSEIAEHLERVRLEDVRRVALAYPHQLSGGMAQRVAIAIAMAKQPHLLIADEPTAALDAQVRGEILNVIFGLAAGASTSIMMLSHDLPGLARHCSRIAVMYGGTVVEEGPAHEVMDRPGHPYTIALSKALPANVPLGARLVSIPGQPPVLTGASTGCSFAPRCAFAIERCTRERPQPIAVGARTVLCHRAVELSATAAADGALEQRPSFPNQVTA